MSTRPTMWKPKTKALPPRVRATATVIPTAAATVRTSATDVADRRESTGWTRVPSGHPCGRSALGCRTRLRPRPARLGRGGAGKSGRREFVDPPGAIFMPRHFDDAQPSFLHSDRMLARAAQPIVRFLHVEAAGGILLVVATVAALIWANSPWQTSYETFWSTDIRIEIGSYLFDEDLLHVVNDL